MWPFCSVWACRIAKMSSCLRMLAAPSMLKFLPIRARSLIFFSLSALRFKPLSSALSGSATRVLPRTIIYTSPFDIRELSDDFWLSKQADQCLQEHDHSSKKVDCDVFVTT